METKLIKREEINRLITLRATIDEMVRLAQIAHDNGGEFSVPSMRMGYTSDLPLVAAIKSGRPASFYILGATFKHGKIQVEVVNIEDEKMKLTGSLVCGNHKWATGLKTQSILGGGITTFTFSKTLPQPLEWNVEFIGVHTELNRFSYTLDYKLFQTEAAGEETR